MLGWNGDARECARPDMKPACLFLLVMVVALLHADDRAGVRESSPKRGAAAGRISPPAQPRSGPGGSDYPHAGIRESEHGRGGKQFWIVEPARPSPAKAPVVIFLHGYSAMHPESYRGWVNHLAKRGNIVVYPRYQEKLLTPPAEYSGNTAAAIHSALAILARPGHVAPDFERVAVVGHSAGGVGAVNYAVRAQSEGLPIPTVVMIVEPGQGMERGIKLVPMDDCAKIPESVRLLVVIGDSDGMVGAGCARTIWQDTKHVRDRSFVTVQSDERGTPPLKANHLSPVSWTREATDALDWYGYWKLLDGLMGAAFAGGSYTVDPGMGLWSDGTPVKPLKVER